MLLIATKYNKPKLYACWSLGKIEEKNWTSIGSGSEYAIKYIREKDMLIPKGISLEEGLDLTINSLDKASQDIYTGGIDIVVVTNSGIEDYGKNIREKVNKARFNAIEKIKKDLS